MSELIERIEYRTREARSGPPTDAVREALRHQLRNCPLCKGDRKHESIDDLMRGISPRRMVDCDRCGPGWEALSAHPPPVEGVADHLRHVIDRDRYIVAQGLGEIRRALESHRWLLEGRGPYEWDDDRYRDEFADWVQNVEAATGLLAKLAWDKRDCTTDTAKVIAAKKAAHEFAIEVKPGHRDMLPSDLGLPCPSCNAARTALQSTPPTDAVREFLQTIAHGAYTAGWACAQAKALLSAHPAPVEWLERALDIVNVVEGNIRGSHADQADRLMELWRILYALRPNTESGRTPVEGQDTTLAS